LSYGGISAVEAVVMSIAKIVMSWQTLTTDAAGILIRWRRLGDAKERRKGPAVAPVNKLNELKAPANR
jgi:hypothetical protein